MRLIKIILLLLPIPFLFHFYEYNSHLAKKEAVLLLPVFLLFIIVVGITSGKIKLTLFVGVNSIMIVISLMLGHFFIIDDGSWFKPFGRDVAIIFISVIYILGQLIIRGIIKAISTAIEKD